MLPSEVRRGAEVRAVARRCSWCGSGGMAGAGGGGGSGGMAGAGGDGGSDPSGWFWRNPIPTGNTLFGVSFVDANTGTAVGDSGTILRTTDGGGG